MSGRNKTKARRIRKSRQNGQGISHRISPGINKLIYIQSSTGANETKGKCKVEDAFNKAFHLSNRVYKR